jgi:hypothetical protein
MSKRILATNSKLAIINVGKDIDKTGLDSQFLAVDLLEGAEVSRDAALKELKVPVEVETLNGKVRGEIFLTIESLDEDCLGLTYRLVL